MSRWYRAYAGTTSDAKIGEVALIAECSRAIVIATWHAILESCAETQEAGKFATTPRRTAAVLGEQAAVIERVFQGLTEVGMIAGDVVCAWAKRQFEGDSSAARVARYRERRKANGLPALGSYTAFKPGLIERDGESCIYCEATGPLVVDHMVPVQLGGTDDEDNLALACKACNAGKAGRTPEMAGLTIKRRSAAFSLKRYRDKNNVTVTVTGASASVSESVEGNVVKLEDARARENDYDRLAKALSEAAGDMPCAASPDISPIFQMIADGWSLDMQILPGIRELRHRKKRPTSWKYVAVTLMAQAEEARGRGPPPSIALPAAKAMTKVLVKWDTPQWWAWDKHLRATTGKGSPKSPKDDGWWFESEWPPKAEATA